MRRHLLAAVVLLIAWGAPAAAARGQGTPPSSFAKSPGGTKVLYLFLQDLGYRMRRVFSLDDLEGGGTKPPTDVALILGDVSRRSARRVLEWVQKGKLAIYAPALMNTDGHCKSVVFGDLKIPRKLRFDNAESSKANIDEGLLLRKAACVATAPETARVLASTKDGALLFEHSVGQGKLLVLAHGQLLVNNTLDEDDMAVIVRRWMQVHAPLRARVAYYEQRHGGALWRMLERAGLLPLVFHGLVLLALVLWMITPRFGDADAFTPARRRAFAEHARSLGTLYLRAGSSGYVLAQLYERFRRRLRYRDPAGGAGVVTGVEGAAERSAIAQRLATRTGGDAESIESLLAQVEYASEHKQNKDSRGVQRDYRLAVGLADLVQRAGIGLSQQGKVKPQEDDSSSGPRDS